MADAWFTDFFDAVYTDVWMRAGSFASTAEEVDGLVSLVPAGSGLRILDIPCGFGRHAGPLTEMGHRVTGIDQSADQLAIARQRNPGPTYLEGDMRHPPEGPFDAVLNLYSSFGYFEDPADDQAAMAAWYDVLVDGGVLIMTGNHRDHVAARYAPGEPRPFGDSGIVEYSTVDWVAGVAHSSMCLPDGSQRHFRVRLYSSTDLVRMATAAGFADIAVFGDFDRRPITPETRLVMRAVKTRPRSADGSSP